MSNPEQNNHSCHEDDAAEEVVLNDNNDLRAQITQHLFDLMNSIHSKKEPYSPEEMHELYEQAKHDVIGDDEDDDDVPDNTDDESTS